MAALERRITKFPGNAGGTIFAKRVTGPDLTESSQLNTIDLPKVPEECHQPRVRPPPLPLKPSLSQQHTSTSNIKRTKGGICRPGTPWQNYNAVLTEIQADSIVLAQGCGEKHTIVAIKEVNAGQDECVKRLRQYSHPNLVDLTEAFLADNTVYMVYEWMDISLADIQSTPCGRLVSFQIAAVCKEVCVRSHIVFSFNGD